MDLEMIFWKYRDLNDTSCQVKGPSMDFSQKKMSIKYQEAKAIRKQKLKSIPRSACTVSLTISWMISCTVSPTISLMVCYKVSFAAVSSKGAWMVFLGKLLPSSPCMFQALYVFTKPLRSRWYRICSTERILYTFSFLHTWAVYVSFTPNIICYICLGGIHKRVNAIHEQGRQSVHVPPSTIHLWITQL